MIKIILSIFLLGIFPLEVDVESEEFEGIIVYKRISKSNIAFETYYFKSGKLRIDSRFISGDGTYSSGDGVTDYSTVFSFEKKMNQYSKTKNCEPPVEISIDSDGIIYFDIDTTKHISILDQNCTLMNVEYKLTPFDSQPKQKRWLSNDLIFSIPDGWILDYSMVSHIDRRIALKIEENIVDASTEETFTYYREAIAIYPKVLSDKVFDL
jgi:hypothetical protein